MNEVTIRSTRESTNVVGKVLPVTNESFRFLPLIHGTDTRSVNLRGNEEDPRFSVPSSRFWGKSDNLSTREQIKRSGFFFSRVEVEWTVSEKIVPLHK